VTLLEPPPLVREVFERERTDQLELIRGNAHRELELATVAGDRALMGKWATIARIVEWVLIRRGVEVAETEWPFPDADEAVTD
jgi:hypothetical protein